MNTQEVDHKKVTNRASKTAREWGDKFDCITDLRAIDMFKHMPTYPARLLSLKVNAVSAAPVTLGPGLVALRKCKPAEP
jgi:hypothetical protein